MGLDKDSPYRIESGLNNGADKANAVIAPGRNFALCISRSIGITPIEQTGNSIPISQDCGNERKESPPNNRRMPDSPK